MIIPVLKVTTLKEKTYLQPVWQPRILHPSLFLWGKHLGRQTQELFSRTPLLFIHGQVSR